MKSTRDIKRKINSIKNTQKNNQGYENGFCGKV